MKRIGLLTVALVLALGSLGIAYAAWTDEVTIEGSIQTGEMRVEWEQFFIRDAPSGHHSDKYVPLYVEAYAYIDPDDPQNAILVIENLYPVPTTTGWTGVGAPEGERVAVTGHAQNMGSIPVKFVDAELYIVEDDNDVADWMRADVRIAKRIGGTWSVIHWAEGVPLMDLPAVFAHANVAGTVLDPGDLFGLGDDTLYLYLHEDAPNTTQDSTLKFTFKLNFIQWNE